MLSWIIANIATILITAVLIAGIVWIVCGMLKDRKRGQSCCGGHCSHCPMGGSCHKH